MLMKLRASFLGCALFACGPHAAPARAARDASRTPPAAVSAISPPASTCRATCSERVLAAHRPSNVLLDADHAYFTDAEKLYAESLASGERKVLFEGDVGHLVDAGDDLLVCRIGPNQRGTQLLLVSKQGGSATVIASDVLCGPATIGADVYYLRLLRDDRAQLERVAKQGGPSRVLLELEAGAPANAGSLRRDLASVELTTDSHDLFWVLEDEVWRFDVAAAALQRIASLSNAQRLIPFKGKLYCATDDTVFEIERGGQTRVAANFQHAAALSAGGDFAYWSAAGLIRFDPMRGTLTTLAQPISPWSLSTVNGRALYVAKKPAALTLIEDCHCTPQALTQSPAVRKPINGNPSADFYLTGLDGELYFTVTDTGGDEDDQISALAKRYGAEVRIKSFDPDIPERFGLGKRYLIHTTAGTFERAVVSLSTTWETDYGWRLNVDLGESPPGDLALVTVLNRAIRFPTAITSNDNLAAKYLPDVQREYKEAGISEPVLAEHVQVTLAHLPAPYAALVAVDVPDPNGSFGERYAALFVADASGDVKLSVSPPEHGLSAYSLQHAIDLYADGIDDVFLDSHYYEGGAFAILVWSDGAPRIVTLHSWGN